MTKHGIYQRETAGETVYDFFWMGERVSEDDFNERLRDQTKSVMKDLDMLKMGADLHEAITSGEKTAKDLDVIEKILTLPICEHCRIIIGSKA